MGNLIFTNELTHETEPFSMKFFKLFLPLILLSAGCSAQTQKQFEIKEIYISNSSKDKALKDFKKKYDAFFEDENYVVRKTCSGEWGGSVYFKSKKSGVEYACSATCPVIINKLNNKYYLTNMLAHLSGSSEIVEIENPDLMSVAEPPKQFRTEGFVIVPIGSDEQQSTKGTHKVTDSIGVLVIGSFPYKNELFHIVTDFNGTYLCSIENNRFRTMDTVSKVSLWSYDQEVKVTKDNHYIIPFASDEANGYIDVVDNKISIIRVR